MDVYVNFSMVFMGATPASPEMSTAYNVKESSPLCL